jgi:large subunit ribosomal protein L9
MMEVILLERVEKLGQMGDVVTVKDGFARNFLLPKKKALRANAANRKDFETRRVDLEANNLEQKSEAEAIAEKMEGIYCALIRQASEGGQLYGSVSARDIAESATEAGFAINRNQVQLDRAIKMLGIHPVRVQLHAEVSVSININAARTAEEAESQKEAAEKGESTEVTAEAVEEVAEVQVEDIFEDGAQADAEAALSEDEEVAADEAPAEEAPAEEAPAEENEEDNA